MDKETEARLQEIVAEEKELQVELDALSDLFVDREVHSLRTQLVEVEHEERKSFGGLNGDSAAGLRITGVKMTLQARLRSLESDKDVREAKRREVAGLQRRLMAERGRLVTRAFEETEPEFDGRMAKLAGEMALVLQERYDLADGYRKRWNAGPSLERLSAIRRGVTPLRAVLGLAVWETGGEAAAREKQANAAAERAQKDRTARYAAEEKRYDGLVRAGRVTPKEREKALAGNREMWGL